MRAGGSPLGAFRECRRTQRHRHRCRRWRGPKGTRPAHEHRTALPRTDGSRPHRQSTQQSPNEYVYAGGDSSGARGARMGSSSPRARRPLPGSPHSIPRSTSSITNHTGHRRRHEARGTAALNPPPSSLTWRHEGPGDSGRLTACGWGIEWTGLGPSKLLRHSCESGHPGT